jgi:two-component system sensor kinase FixL
MERRPRPSEDRSTSEPESYRVFFEKSPLPMWVLDLETLRFLDVNEAALRMYGFSRAEFLRLTIEDIRPPEDAPRLRETLQSLKPTDRLFGFWRHRKKDGTVFDVEVLSTEVRTLGRRARLVLVHDVTERQAAERHHAAQLAVLRVLIESKSFSEAAVPLIEALCPMGGWGLGEVWMYDAEASILRLHAWHAPGGKDVPGRGLASSGVTVRPGESLIGRAWQRNEPLSIRDVFDEADREWAESGVRLGLRSAVAFPIRTRSGPEAVAVLYGRPSLEPDAVLLDLLQEIGSGIGRLLERDHADAARRASVEAFQKAFQASPVAMGISLLKDGRFIEVNLEFLKMFGLERSEVVGKTSIELGLWVDTEQRRVLAERLRERGTIRDAEVIVRTKRGHVLHALMSVEYLDLRDQQTIITTLVDITDRVEARDAQRRLAAIVEGTDDAIFSKDLEGTITTWNAGAERVFGYTGQEAIGQNVALMVPTDKLAELEQILDRLRRGERIEHLETVRTRKDGHRIVVSLSISPLSDGTGRLMGAATIARDITERKRAEQLVRRSEARFRQLFEAAADPIILIDRRGTILELNPAAAALIGGKDPVALRGVNLGELIPPRELEKNRAYLRDLLHDRPVAEPFETYIELEGGELRFLQARSRVIREEGSEPYVQVIVRDVTSEKEFQRKILEGERRASASQVASFIAHEINTPLTNIALLSASLARGLKDPKALEKLGKIDQQRRFATNILAELLALTRSHDVKRVPVDVRGLLEAAIEQAASSRRGSARLVRDLPSGPVVASVDPLRIQQAVVNLLRNAFQATDSGAITLRLRADGGKLTIAVADTGPGMDEEVRSRMFQPFYTTKPRDEGLGLGLVLVKHVVEAHHGTIDVASEPGQGSTFTIALPLQGSDAEPPPPPAATRPTPSPKAP